MAEEKKDFNAEEVEENKDVENQDKDDDAGKADDKSDKADDKESKGSTGKTFTQEQVNKMMTREKNQGRNAVYKELGIDPKDTKTVNMFKAFMASQKSEEEMAAEKDSENQAKMNEAEQRAIFAEAKAEAMMLGVKPQYVEDVVTLALAKMTEDSDIKTLIGELKTKYSIWFGESDEDEKDDKKGKTGQKGTGSSVKNKEKESKEGEKGLGARLAAQRKTGNKKSSYWGR